MHRTSRALILALAALAGCSDDSPAPSTTNDGGAPDTSTPDGAPMADAALPAPAIAVTAPEANAFVISPVRITGTVAGATVANVEVNGSRVPVRDGAFVTDLVLDPGPQVIAVVGGRTRVEVPVSVDALAPTLDITSPARGAWQEEAEVELAFTAADDQALAEVRIDDLNTDTGAGPDFRLALPVDPGLNVIRVDAQDAAGHVTSDHTSVLRGPFGDPDQPLSGAIRARIGIAAFAVIEQVATRVLDEADLAAILPAEPFALGPVSLTVGAIRHARPSTLDITPAAGALDVSIRVTQLEIDVTLSLDEETQYPLVLRVQAVDAHARVTPSVAGGGITVDVGEMAIELTNLEVSPGDLPPDWDDPERVSLVEDAVEELLLFVAESYVGDFVAGFLGGFEATTTFEFFGRSVELSVIPEALAVTTEAIVARLAVAVRPVSDVLPDRTLPGYPSTPSTWDGAPMAEHLGIAIDDDVVNLLLYQLWRVGALIPTLDGDFIQENMLTLRITFGMLSDVGREAHPGIAATTALAMDMGLTLPPVARLFAGDAGPRLGLALGDVALTATTENAAAVDVLDGYLSLELDAGFGLAEGGAPRLALDFAPLRGWFDSTSAAYTGDREARIEAVAGVLVDSFAQTLPQRLGAGIPLPALPGIGIDDLSFDVVGPEGGFLGIDMRLSAP